MLDVYFGRGKKFYSKTDGMSTCF